MIWNYEFETLPREALEALQLKRLQATAERVYATVPFYKKKFDERGVKPGHIKSLKDIRLLPFTVKNDLRDNYPYGLFSTPMESVVRVHASSGTTGKPIVVGYTRRDIDTWAEVMARTLSNHYRDADGYLHVFTLSPQVETLLRSALGSSEAGISFQLDAAMAQKLLVRTGEQYPVLIAEGSHA